MAIPQGPSRGQLVSIRKVISFPANVLGIRKHLCLAKQNDRPETKDVPPPQT
jgi:hypothetical protein